MTSPDPVLRPLLLARSLRALCDGAIAVLLPVYLHALGYGLWAIGLISSLTLLGSALATLALGAFAHRWPSGRWLLAAAWLMVATGLGFACGGPLAWLALVGFVGTLNPSSGDVSVFLPLEHARLASLPGEASERTRRFALYSISGSFFAAVGALGAGLPLLLQTAWGWPLLSALRAMFIGYAAIGLLIAALYARVPQEQLAQPSSGSALGPSRRTVLGLALLFSVDSLGGGFVVNTLLAAWLQTRHGLAPASIGTLFFCTGLLGTASQWLAPRLAARFGLLATMVFTHIPANLFLMLAALAPSAPLAIAALLARSLLSQMDVPARSAYVMAVVTPPERAAAASFTAVPRSLAAALSPSLGAALMSAGWLGAPLLIAGALKIAYDLSLWQRFKHHPIE